MRSAFRVSLTAVIALTICGAVMAQTPNSPNATMLINGQDALFVDPVDADVLVAVPQPLAINFSSANANAGIIVLISLVNPAIFPVLAVPQFPGNLDIGTFTGAGIANVAIFADGVSSPLPPDAFFRTDTFGNFDATFGVGVNFNNQRFALQSIFQDPTQAIPFRFSSCADLNFFTGQVTNLATFDDGSVQVAFAPGKVFNFHGVAYTDIFVVGNGYVNFGNFTTVNAAGFTGDVVSWVNAEPSIALHLADWNSGADGVLYEEIGPQLRIAYGDPIADPTGIPHFADASVNNFEVILQLDDGTNPNEGQFRVRNINLDPNATNDNGSGVLGHSPGGGVLAGGAVDVQLHTGVGAFGLPNEAQLEEHNGDTFNATVVGFDGLGTPRSYWDSTQKWNGQAVDFFPNPPVSVTGDQGYLAIRATAAPETLGGIDLATVSDAGGQTATLSGSFYTFDPAAAGAGTVVFDPDANFGGPYPAVVTGIVDGSGESGGLSLPNPLGPVRDGEGLVIITPPMPGVLGNVPVEATWASGTMRRVNVFVAPAGVIINTFLLGDDNFITHPLTVPITYYGTVHNQVILNSNGYVSFTSGSGDFTPSTAEFFNGWNLPPNPGVGIVYTDLNSGGTGSGASTTVLEDMNTGIVRIDYNNQNWWSTVEPAGNFSCTFGTLGPNSVEIDTSGLLAAGAAIETFLTGVTDGDNAVGIDTDLSDGLGTGIFNNLGVYASASGPDSICEISAATTAVPFAGPTTWLDVGGGTGIWTIF